MCPVSVVIKYIMGQLYSLCETRYIFKEIYDEVTEDIFDMCNVRFFYKEIEKKKMGDVYTLLCLRSAEFS